MQVFFNHTCNDGRTNGQRLNAAYDQNDPTTWSGIVWDSSTPKRVSRIDLFDGGFEGALNISNFTSLEFIDCQDNGLTALDISGATSLITLRCAMNEITNLNVSASIFLTNLDCGHNYSLTALDVSQNIALERLYFNYSAIPMVNIEMNSNLVDYDFEIVTYDKNGGDTNAVPRVIGIQQYSLLSTQPTPPMREGYTFEGWYKESECITPWVFCTGDHPEFFLHRVENDMTLYAKWEAVPEPTPEPTPEVEGINVVGVPTGVYLDEGNTRQIIGDERVSMINKIDGGQAPGKLLALEEVVLRQPDGTPYKGIATFSPIAVIVQEGIAAGVSPKTGDSEFLIVWLTIEASALFALLYLTKKKRSNIVTK